MVGGAAGHYADLGQVPDLILLHTGLGEVDLIVRFSLFVLLFPHHGTDGVADRLGLFMDFLDHEMLEAAFFGDRSVPFDPAERLVHHIAVQIEESHALSGQARHLEIVDVIDIPGIFQDGRHVRGDILVVAGGSDDQRAVLTRHIDFIRIVPEHHGQRIGAADTHHGFGQGVDRSDLILLVIVIHQLDSDFRVRLGVERVAVTDQLVSEFLVVLDDPVVHADHTEIVRDVGVCVGLRRLSVRRPSRVADSAESGNRPASVGFLRQDLQPSLGLDQDGVFLMVPHRKTRRVISAIFQLG